MILSLFQLIKVSDLMKKLTEDGLDRQKETIMLKIVLLGAGGVGKTSIAYALQNEFDLDLLELNASDFRNKEQLQIKLKPASEQASLFKKSKVN